MQSVTLRKQKTCQHDDVHEIGLDFDKYDNPVRLIRCRRCGQLMRENLLPPRYLHRNMRLSKLG